MKQMIEIDELVRSMATLPSCVQCLHPTQQPLVEFTEDAHRVEDSLAAFEEPGQDLFDIADRERIVGTVAFNEPFGPLSRAVPEFLLPVTLAAEHDELTVRPARHQHRNRIRLFESG